MVCIHDDEFYAIPQSARMTLKGNNRMAFSSLKMMSIENPTILNGKRISQTNGNSMSIKRAIGQQVMKRKAQRIKAMNVRIGGFGYNDAKALPH
jgi:hypothetical protein